ncbi:MAG: 50S ribosomal protein L25 [Dehalococcoidia bacterium]
MAKITLNARPRTVLGKKVATLRRAGITPANIYGHNVVSTAIEADTHDLGLLLRRAGRTGLVEVTVEGEREPRNVLVRDIRRRATTGDLIHVDFLQVSMTERLTVNVPLVLTGQAPVLGNSDALVFQNLDSLEVSCLPGDIPDHINVDVTGMTETTSVIHVRDLTLPAGVTAMNDADGVVASVTVQGAEEEGRRAGPWRPRMCRPWARPRPPTKNRPNVAIGAGASWPPPSVRPPPPPPALAGGDARSWWRWCA